MFGLCALPDPVAPALEGRPVGVFLEHVCVPAWLGLGEQAGAHVCVGASIYPRAAVHGHLSCACTCAEKRVKVWTGAHVYACTCARVAAAGRRVRHLCRAHVRAALQLCARASPSAWLSCPAWLCTLRTHDCVYPGPETRVWLHPCASGVRVAAARRVQRWGK